jgi:iron complex transport system ATP-binding protein
MTAPVLHAQAVSCRLGNRLILDQVDLAAHAGTLTCLLGPNGAGKSTLLRALAGDLALSTGAVSFADRPLSDWPAAALARRRAVMTQKPATAFDFSSLEVVLLGRHPHCAGRPGRRDTELAHRALGLAEATHLSDRSITTLSGGEAARVHFARVLAQAAFEEDGTPHALLLDEPTASLDLAHQHALMRTARQLAHERGLAVVAVVHDLNLAARYADRAVLVAAGRVMASGTPADVLRPEHVTRCFGIQVVQVTPAGHDVPLLLVTD